MAKNFLTGGGLSLLVLFLFTTLYVGMLSPSWERLLERPLLAGGLLSLVLWFPGIVGLMFARYEGISLRFFCRPNRYYFLGPLLIAGVLLFLGKKLLWLPLFYVWALTGGMVFALGEEIYWRGYLWEKWKESSPRAAIVAIGLVWGIWHYPFLFFLSQYVPGALILGSVYPENPVWGAVLLPIYTVLLSFLLAYFRKKGGAIMVPAAMHGMINLGVALSWRVYRDPNDFLYGITGILGIVITFLICLALKLFSINACVKK